jgi:N utilization substance protein A
MATSEIKLAIAQVASERGIPVEDVLNSIKNAIARAYAKEYGGEAESFSVEFDDETGEIKILDESGADVTKAGFGRIAVNAAKQALTSKVREVEKDIIYQDFIQKKGKIVSGNIFRIDRSSVVIDLGKVQGIMPYSEQVPSEEYRIGHRIKVLIKDVTKDTKDPQVIVSRASGDFVAQLFEAEVPEIANGTVEITAVAREAGSRTKMAVYSNDEKIDPVGSCVGQKGVRVQAIIHELFGEKIDIIPFSRSIEKYIASALSPARVTEVVIEEAEEKAIVSVPEDQLSLAIGKDGQNVRLANKLTHWKIDIKGTKTIFDSETGRQSEVRESSSSVSKPSMGIWDQVIAEAKAEAEKKAKEDQEILNKLSEEKTQAPAENTEENSEETK